MKFRRLVTGIGVLPQKRLQRLLWSAAVLAAFSADGAASAAPCGNLLTASAATPSGFAAAYNPFTPAKELLLQGTDCAAGAAKISVGSGSAEQYVYKNALYWTGSAWQELPLSGSALISDTWYKGSATASMPIGETPRYLLGYVCQSSAGAWKCGCSDTACAKPQWQLQAVQAPAGADAAKPSATAINGKLDGIWYWPMPKTPNGLVPTQSWSGAASTPSGDVYVAGMDHTTNSALYRLHDGVLGYVGDAKSASKRQATGSRGRRPRSSTRGRRGTTAAPTSPRSTTPPSTPPTSAAGASTGTPTTPAPTGSSTSARRSRAGRARLMAG